MIKIDEEVFIDTCNNSKSMYEAAIKLGLHYNTFKRYAIKLKCFHPNQSGKGLSKPKKSKILTEDILAGKYPQFQTYKLKTRLIDENYKEDKCEICGWNKKRLGEKYTPCELHHKNGDRADHRLFNLQILCPNCHSLEEHYRAKNVTKN